MTLFLECPFCYSPVPDADENGWTRCEQCRQVMYVPRIDRQIMAGKRFVAAVGERIWK